MIRPASPRLDRALERGGIAGMHHQRGSGRQVIGRVDQYVMFRPCGRFLIGHAHPPPPERSSAALRRPSPWTEGATTRGRAGAAAWRRKDRVTRSIRLASFARKRPRPPARRAAPLKPRDAGLHCRQQPGKAAIAASSSITSIRNCCRTIALNSGQAQRRIIARKAADRLEAALIHPPRAGPHRSAPGYQPRGARPCPWRRAAGDRACRRLPVQQAFRRRGRADVVSTPRAFCIAACHRCGKEHRLAPSPLRIPPSSSPSTIASDIFSCRAKRGFRGDRLAVHTRLLRRDTHP